MWTQEHRERQRAFEQRRNPTDLTEAQWEQFQPLLPKPAPRGRKLGADVREILNAIRYLSRAGCGWRRCSRTLGRGRPCTGGSGAPCAGFCFGHGTMGR